MKFEFARKGLPMKKHVPVFMLLIFVLAFSGCEMPPEPQHISETQYMNLTCDQISQEQHRVKAALAAATDALRGRLDYGMGGDFNGVQVSAKSYGLSEIDKLKEDSRRFSKLLSRKAVRLLQCQTNIYRTTRLNESPMSAGK